MFEYGCKIEEKVKAMQSEIKENVQGTNCDGKETRAQIKNLVQKEEINIQLEQNKEKRNKKYFIFYKERLRNLWDNFKCSPSESKGCQKEERKSKKLRTYLKK